MGRPAHAHVNDAVLVVALLDLHHHRHDALLVLAREADGLRVVEQLQEAQVALPALEVGGGEQATRLERDLLQHSFARGHEVAPHEDRPDGA